MALAASLGEAPKITARDMSARQAADSGAALGIDLYHTLAAKDGNIVFSPYSISEIVALLSAGAKGETREELLAALHWSLNPDLLSQAYGAQDRHLNQPAEGNPTVLVANGLWHQQGSQPNPVFLEVAKDDYGAEVRSADFKGNASPTRHEINSWVGLKTLGKIPDLLPDGALDQGTRLALVNAVYFKGKWEHPFEARHTSYRPFFLLSGTSVSASQMSRTERHRETTGPGCDILELPYEGGRLAMVVLLPRAANGLPALEKNLTSSRLCEWLAALDFSREKSVKVTLPRFNMTYGVELTDALKQSGVTATFDAQQADFSAIDGKRDLHVSTVLHRAFIDVDEDGTEAAAATFAGVAVLAVERSQEFKADHPFLFLIRDNVSGCLLFLGRVVDPRAG
jgi:serpin B